MRAIYLDCFSGISGNMLLGAFLQAGLPLAYLEGELKKVLPGDEFSITASPVKKNGISAVYVDVEVKYEKAVFRSADEGVHHTHEHTHDHVHEHDHKHGHTHTHEHTHDHAHEHDCEHGHTHSHEHDHTHAHGHYHHQHRTFGDIVKLIEASKLSPNVKKTSLKIFTSIAEAEAKVHDSEVDKVHFHEVGATDSIVDIVGTAIALDYLKIGQVFVSQVNTGSGFVNCAHGLMPVPAPATAELLLGIPCYHHGAQRELTTPTGAAVLKTLAVYAENIPPDFVTENVAYGAGTWELPIPNMLRMFIGTCPEMSEQKHWLIETNIDDMDSRIYGFIFERLLDAGALDVWVTPTVMKKNRPANVLSVLTDEAHKEDCCDIIFKETTSIGLRIQAIEQRREAVRRIAKVKTEYGEVACKVSAYKGEIVSVSAEYDDCRRLALEKKVPLKQVRQAALSEIGRRLGE